MFLYGFVAASAGRQVDADPMYAWFFAAVAFLTPIAYFALLESSASQATFGKAALSLKVVDLGGRRISFARALGRYLGKIPSSLFFVGFLMAAFTERKQALHDKMAGTLVVRRR
jgi:uncharacterized RDD family membrane protein YckC